MFLKVKNFKVCFKNSVLNSVFENHKTTKFLYKNVLYGHLIIIELPRLNDVVSDVF